MGALFRIVALLAIGAAIGVVALIVMAVSPRDLLEFLDGAGTGSIAKVETAVEGAARRSTVRAKERAADFATETATQIVDGVAARLKEETDRAAEDAKRSFAEEARGALGLNARAEVSSTTTANVEGINERTNAVVVDPSRSR